MTLLHKYLTFTRPEIEPPPPSADDDDDELPDEGSGSLEEIRGTICEIMDLYVQRYSDVFPDHDGSQTVEWPTVNKFVETTWVLLTSLGPSRRFDTVSRHCLLSYLMPRWMTDPDFDPSAGSSSARRRASSL